MGEQWPNLFLGIDVFEILGYLHFPSIPGHQVQ